MAVFFLARLSVFLCLVATAPGAKVTPMEKVITLLKDLSGKLAAEGKKEAAQYDKYSCFCKDQADGKTYALEKSEEKLAGLRAQIKELKTAIAELNSEISGLSKKISELETEIKTSTEKRDEEHGEYLTKAKDMSEAIEACGAAIGALKDSKKSMKGAKLDFAQVKKATSGLLGAVSQQPLLAIVPGAVALLAELNGKAAPKFEYQSNDIIATLESLEATFKSMKKDLDVEEFDVNSAFESKKLGLFNEKTFAEKEKGEKETLVEAKTEQLETANTDASEETKDRDADQVFLDELTKDCQEKAVLFDQRSQTRAEELTAITDAIEELKKGAMPNYGANKKLVGVQVKSVVQKAAVSPVSFVQIANVRHDNPHNKMVLLKVLNFLHGAAGRTGSAALKAAAMRVKMAEDHFVKVRALIKDLITRLKADAAAEASQKCTCDKGMKKAIADRDESKGKAEIADAKITTLKAKENALVSDINGYQKDIADLRKAILEATELRDEDKADNSKTILMSEEAINSVKLALEILKDFYKGAAFTQTSKYVPPKSDREGNTVGDLAPEVFNSEYKGAQSDSKGIIGILEVILSDFERTKTTTDKDEKQSKEAFEQLEKDTNEDIKEKEKLIKNAEGDLADTKSSILDEEQNLSDAKGLLESSLSALEGLEAMCVKGEETWEERKKKREEEIEALKEAMAILEEWQG